MTEVSGEFEMGKQYHFHMETQSCIVRPIENGEWDVFSATQFVDGVQFVVSKTLGVTKNKVNVSVSNNRVQLSRIDYLEGEPIGMPLKSIV